ncbi:MAG TPA: FUSC family protein [Mycobacteriales bacterium]|nr:FUSC family protein [Mycobacteriales bacterium]
MPHRLPPGPYGIAHLIVRPDEIGMGLRRAMREAARFDRAALAPLAGIRVALGVVIALVIGRLFHNPGAEASIAAGALLAGIPAAVSGGRMSVRSLVVLSAGMAVSTFVGSTSAQLGWVHTAVVVPWCLLAGLLLALGGAATSIGTQGLAAMIVFGRFAESPAAAAHLAGYVLAGGLLATAIMALTRPPVTAALQRRSIAAGLTSLAELAGAGVTQRKGVASAEALEAADRLLGSGLRLEEEQNLRLRALLDVARRSRLELLVIEGLGRRLTRVDDPPVAAWWAAVEGALVESARAFTALAEELTAPTGHARQAVQRSTEAAHAARRNLAAAEPNPSGAVFDALQAHLAALAGQLRAAAELVGRAGTGNPRRRVRPVGRSTVANLRAGAGEAWDTLTAQATVRSPIGRHAVRLAVAVTAAELIARHTPLGRGYWVALTASVVLRPDFSVTFSRGFARMLGTSVGVVLAGLLAVVLHGRAVADIIAIGVLCVAALASFPASYAMFTGFLTGLVVLLVGVATPSTVGTAFDRLADTLVGGVLALTVYALWPTWSQQQAAQAFAALVARQRDYLVAVLAVVSGERSLHRDELRGWARDARRAKAEADEALVRAADDPERHRFRLAQGQGIIAATSRISLAIHALRTDVEDGRPGGPVPEAAALAAALSGALAVAGDRLQPGPGRLAASQVGASQQPNLRACYEQLAGALAGRPETGPLLSSADELVDAVNTLNELLAPARE